MKMVYVKYVCKQCGADDTEKYFPNETPAPVVNCYKCHSGLNKTREEMLISGQGMFPEQTRRAANH